MKSGFITLIINKGSGHDDKATARDTIVARLHAAGKSVKVVELPPSGNISAACARAVSDLKHKGGIALAAGGDGTVTAVATACIANGVPMGVIPMGTFNYFARALGIPVDIEKATDIVAQGHMKAADAGIVQDRIFLNNASFGVYTRVIRNREEDKSHFGRYRIVALASQIRSMFMPAKVYGVRVGTDEKQQLYRTTMIFASINKLQLEALGLHPTEGAEKMSVNILKPVTRFEMLRIMARTLLRNVASDAQVEGFCTNNFTVEAPLKNIDCVLDGEIVRLAMPLEFKVLPAALQVAAPSDAEAEAVT